MNARRMRGSTLIEALGSSGLLSLLVLAAFATSRTTLTATSTVASADAAASRSDHTFDRLRELLLSASVGTLQGVPPQGVVAEPMQPGVDYDNVEFRIVSGFVGGAVEYVPPVTLKPWQVRLEHDQTGGDARLVFDDGRSSTRLLEGVQSAAFRLDGKCLHVSLTMVGDAGHDSGMTRDLDFVLLVP